MAGNAVDVHFAKEFSISYQCNYLGISLIIPTIQYMASALIIIYAKYSILWFLSLRDSNTFNDTKIVM